MPPSARDLAAEDLKRSGITLEQAEAAGFLVCDNAKEEVYDDFKAQPALVIPYADPSTGEIFEFESVGELRAFCRVRYLTDGPKQRGFVKKKTRRYDQPKNSGMFAYFPQTDEINWREVLDDPETPICITEGEKKALVGCLSGVPTIGLGGVFNFADKSGAFLAELAAVNWRGRAVYVCFDSDAAGNPNIQAAEGRLATELSIKHRADVFVARIPKLPGQDKTGLDDLYAAKGADAIFKVLESAPQMNKVDGAVLGLNASVAWIERDGMIYDMESQDWIRKGDFFNGSKYSALKVLVPTLKGAGAAKWVSIAAEFLTHPLARRYKDIVFKPEDESETVITEVGESYNLWRGWEPDHGDVTPFLELSDFLFKDTEPEAAELPLKLLAYKAQNPGEKVPLALVLLGTQGCGKSFWSQIVREAFAPYGVAVDPRALVSEFNGFVERSLVAVLDEAKGLDVYKGGENLKRLISEKKTYMNEKYRVARQVDSYTMYILTSNDRRVGAYSQDDRRMVVISCPKKREQAFYDRVKAWSENGGPKKLLGWLLDYDLKGWKPPQSAPMTAEKYMAYMESLTPVQRLAEEMQTADENVVKAWLDASMAWATEAAANDRTAGQAREVAEAVRRYQIRPFYTAEELAIIFPAV